MLEGPWGVRGNSEQGWDLLSSQREALEGMVTPPSDKISL